MRWRDLPPGVRMSLDVVLLVAVLLVALGAGLLACVALGKAG